MGKGYWILLADGYGDGLILINPRLHAEGSDTGGNPRNWWPDGGEDYDAICKRHGLVGTTSLAIIIRG